MTASLTHSLSDNLKLRDASASKKSFQQTLSSVLQGVQLFALREKKISTTFMLKNHIKKFHENVKYIVCDSTVVNVIESALNSKPFAWLF